jgi:hypothetical protein
MYKESLGPSNEKEAAALLINKRREDVAAKLLMDQGDDEFNANLLDLCVLNRMAEVHPVEKSGGFELTKKDGPK